MPQYAEREEQRAAQRVIGSVIVEVLVEQEPVAADPEGSDPYLSASAAHHLTRAFPPAPTSSPKSRFGGTHDTRRCSAEGALVPTTGTVYDERHVGQVGSSRQTDCVIAGPTGVFPVPDEEHRWQIV